MNSHSSLSKGDSLSDVLLQLGPPLRISSSAQGYVLAWEFWRVNEDSLGISLGALGADVFSIDWGKAKVSGEFLMLAFDHEHRLASATYSLWDNRSGGGSALQPLLGIADVVEVGDLVQALPQHEWGETLLGPLPHSLNSSSRPDMGSSGIQQRGTPSGVGQQSLEMH
ncbi:hypothetical protein H2508_11235 [Parahaliea sp. F7430]|uniref:Uncharacterized protein n=1 Tax=Sediminihaliea albiluteola TaxID=2758564 RepID=A0A7W2TXB4_9GAMM|nr:hypothetical protein [Sediminihaliea albiluteola]MBA6413682.1 hypothetical protein [Sediminihaliea albiluteola]